MRIASLAAASSLVLALAGTAHAAAGASNVIRYDAAYAGLKTKYLGLDNEQGSLAWGEGALMASLVAAYEGTGDARWLVELVDHADAALEQRDSVRGVTDYRGKSLPCWRSTKYIPTGEPYCWAVHTGMIATPLAELAALVKEQPALAGVATHDGKTLGKKADVYLKAAEDAAFVHLDEWKQNGLDGYYLFRPDMAGFYANAGQAVPLNMMNAMGLLHLALARVSADAASHAAKAQKLVQHFLDNKTISNGGYYWNYGGGPYVAPGEDISHGALNARFVSRAVEQGVLVTKKSQDALVQTFLDGILVDTQTFHDNVGGGANTQTYAAQVPSWLVTRDVRVHAIARDFLGDLSTAGSGSVLFGMSLLVRHDARVGPFDFYAKDWQDDGASRSSTAANANLTILPYDPKSPQLARIFYKAAGATPVQQWDGAAYHTVTVLPPAASFMLAHVPFVPELFFDYGGGKALFQLTGPAGIAVQEPETIALPKITSVAPGMAAPAAPVVYKAAASGWDPKVWKLDGPGSVDANGVVTFTTPASGTVAFTLTVTNDAGTATQAFTVNVIDPGGGAGGAGGATTTTTTTSATGAGGAGGASTSTGTTTTTTSTTSTTTSPPGDDTGTTAPAASSATDTSSGCAVRGARGSNTWGVTLAAAALVLAARRRARR